MCLVTFELYQKQIVHVDMPCSVTNNNYITEDKPIFLLKCLNRHSLSFVIYFSISKFNKWIELSIHQLHCLYLNIKWINWGQNTRISAKYDSNLEKKEKIRASVLMVIYSIHCLFIKMLITIFCFIQ